MRRLVTGIAALAIVSCALAGCGAGPAETRPPAGTGGASGVRKGEGIRVSLSCQPRVAKPGAVFSLTLEVRNLSGAARTFDLPSSKAYEFVAYDIGGSPAWRWSKGVFFTQALTPVTIAPDESKSFKVAWDPAGLAAGKYRVEGYFLGVEGLKPAVDVEVSP
jgi:hypothetical protein